VVTYRGWTFLTILFKRSAKVKHCPAIIQRNNKTFKKLNVKIHILTLLIHFAKIFILLTLNLYNNTMEFDKVAEKLRKKGWDEDYIAKTISIMKDAEKNKSENVIKFEKILFWTALFLTIIGNQIVLIAIFMVIMSFSLSFVLLITSAVAVCFGAFLDSVFKEIDLINARHFFIAGVAIPIIGLSIVFFSIASVQTIFRARNVYITHNILLLATIYLITFSLPHFLYNLVEYVKRAKNESSGVDS